MSPSIRIVAVVIAAISFVVAPVSRGIKQPPGDARLLLDSIKPGNSKSVKEYYQRQAHHPKILPETALCRYCRKLVVENLNFGVRTCLSSVPASSTCTPVEMEDIALVSKQTFLYQTPRNETFSVSR